MLIDLDFIKTHNPENALQHSIAWLLGFTTAVRSGSLVKMANREGFLKWGDMKMYRETSRTGFTIRITFEWWKDWSDKRFPTKVKGVIPRMLDKVG